MIIDVVIANKSYLDVIFIYNQLNDYVYELDKVKSLDKTMILGGIYNEKKFKIAFYFISHRWYYCIVLKTAASKST